MGTWADSQYKRYWDAKRIEKLREWWVDPNNAVQAAVRKRKLIEAISTPAARAKANATRLARSPRRDFLEANGLVGTYGSIGHANYWWAWNLWTKYHITLAQYDRMLDQQNGVCTICGKPPRRNRLHVDHDHSTGIIRGLLCAPCNRHVGYLEKIWRRERVLAYLCGGEVSVPS
jgi:hypothetical protein